MAALLVGRRLAVGFAAIGSVIIAVLFGVGALVGTLLAGVVLSSWAFVYAHVMCAGEQPDLQAMTRTAAWGACSAPIVVVACTLLGSPAVALTVVVAGLWVAAVTPTGHLPGTPYQQATRATRSHPPNWPNVS